MAALRDLRALGRGLGADMRASAGLTKGETT